jgi:hypothetical protein
MSRRAAVAAASATVALLCSCTASLQLGGPPSNQPHCIQPYQGRPDHLDGSLVLAAQSVPTADLVPCVRQLPAGWTVREFSAQRGRSRLWLNLGNNNENALELIFTRSCDVGGARRTPSDEPGTLRFDDLRLDASAYRGTRFYTFGGGCVTDHFDVHGAEAAQSTGMIMRALAFVERTALRGYLDDYSKGRFHLDPPPRR